jgi:hypothetical protein
VYDMMCSSSDSGRVDSRDFLCRSLTHGSSVRVYWSEVCEVRAVEVEYTLENIEDAAVETDDSDEAVEAFEFARESVRLDRSSRSEVRVDGRFQSHWRGESLGGKRATAAGSSLTSGKGSGLGSGRRGIV